MRKIFLFITAFVCASTMNLFAEDTRTVVSECSFTGWNPSIINVGDDEVDAGEALALTLKAPEGAPYYVSPTMLRFYKWDNATNQYKMLEHDDTVTAGVYVATFQIRIDNSGNYYATGMEYGDHQYGYSHRFDTDGMITYINGRKTEIYETPTISNDYSYYFSQTPVFYVGMDGFKEDYYLPGKFSINADGDSVQFSQGNLQFYPHMVSWQFANNQYDIIGEGNKYIDTPSNPNNDDIIDLFGWGTGDQAGKYSTDNADYATFTDWAPAIKEDIGLTGNWRTLTLDEWQYIMNTRPNAAQLKAKATVAGQTGLIILPDNWDLTVLPLNTTDNDYTANVFELNQWLAWEAQGAIFLPAAGVRAGTTYGAQLGGEDFGAYWTASEGDAVDNASCMILNKSGIGFGTSQRCRGLSVRLAREVPKKAVISECTFTGFDPSVLTVGGLAHKETDKLVEKLIPAEGAPYFVSHTRHSLYKYNKEYGIWSPAYNNPITEGIYRVSLHIRIDNSGNEGDTTGYAEHLYGDLYRFDSTKVTTYVDGVEWSMDDADPQIAEHDSYYLVVSPAFMVRDSQKENFVPGKFSVNAEGDQIQFTNGNLQYNPLNGFWKLAENQWDTIGVENTKINDPKFNDWIDLFGWGTGDAPAKYSADNADYATFTDWGPLAAEQIAKDSGWYTLSKDEWDYILTTRANASQLRGRIVVNGIRGLILLPDNWDLTAKPINSSNVFTDSINAEEWVEWEAQGAVFLPAAGLRSNTSIYSLNAYGFYWSSSVANDTKASSVRFNASECAMYDAARSSGASVRLAREVLPTYKVTIVTENCSVTVEPESIDLNAVEQGTVLTLTAVPETNFRFKEWQNYNPETGLVVTSDTTITAICAKLWVVTKAEVTGGHVSITYWGTDHELTADELLSVPDGTRLTFTAIPDEGYRFVGWTPASAYASTTYIVNQPITYDFTVTPVFRRNGVFAVTIQPQYGGEVTCTTEGVNLEEVESGTKLTFKANPIAGWAVNRWAGSPNLVINYETTPDIAELTVTTDETITCYFAELPPAEAIDEIQSEEKAVKFIRNGQLFILRDGKTYNALGMEIK